MTNELERRVAEHKEGNPGSFKARYKVTRLVYFEHFDDIHEAIAGEKGIKRMLHTEDCANRVDEPAVAGLERRVKQGRK